MAPKTESRFTLDLILDAVPNSSASILLTREIWSLGGIMSEIMLVPLLMWLQKNVSNFIQQHWVIVFYSHQRNRMGAVCECKVHALTLWRAPSSWWVSWSSRFRHCDQQKSPRWTCLWRAGTAAELISRRRDTTRARARNVWSVAKWRGGKRRCQFDPQRL